MQHFGDPRPVQLIPAPPPVEIHIQPFRKYLKFGLFLFCLISSWICFGFPLERNLLGTKYWPFFTSQDFISRPGFPGLRFIVSISNPGEGEPHQCGTFHKWNLLLISKQTVAVSKIHFVLLCHWSNFCIYIEKQRGKNLIQSYILFLTYWKLTCQILYLTGYIGCEIMMEIQLALDRQDNLNKKSAYGYTFGTHSTPGKNYFWNPGKTLGRTGI